MAAQHRPANRAVGSWAVGPRQPPCVYCVYWAAMSATTPAHSPQASGCAANSVSKAAGTCSSTIPPRHGGNSPAGAVLWLGGG
jgi:hypothetical protein